MRAREREERERYIEKERGERERASERERGERERERYRKRKREEKEKRGKERASVREREADTEEGEQLARTVRYFSLVDDGTQQGQDRYHKKQKKRACNAPAKKSLGLTHI